MSEPARWAVTMIREMEALVGSPRTPEGIKSIATRLESMCGDEATARWLVNRIMNGAQRFPAPVEMRRILCQHCPPADGLEERQVDVSDFMGFSGKKES